MSRNYEVEGTKAYLIAAIVLALLAAWHIWDGWFPRDSWLAKYPNYPGDGFYLFNRVTGVLMGIASVICAYIHKVVK